MEGGEQRILGALRDLYQRVKAIDSVHPVTHSNWPPTKDLDLRFLDFACFNLYPLWPPEVVAMGYGKYIQNVLRPAAGNKPLLISEFGVNDLEAGRDGQARLLKECWLAIRQTDACGGIAFAFADEWWKNYDNPVRHGSWWSRAAATEDEKTHDPDPEEHYGLVTADRQPKPAYAVLKQLYAESKTPSWASERVVPLALSSVVVAFAATAWWRARRRNI